jgi:hypothetical protein
LAENALLADAPLCIILLSDKIFDEIYTLYNDLNIAEDINIRRLG